MTCNHLYEELVDDCQTKLNRELTLEEIAFLKWIEQKQMETTYKQVRSS